MRSGERYLKSQADRPEFRQREIRSGFGFGICSVLPDSNFASMPIVEISSRSGRSQSRRFAKSEARNVEGGQQHLLRQPRSAAAILERHSLDVKLGSHETLPTRPQRWTALR